MFLIFMLWLSSFLLLGILPIDSYAIGRFEQERFASLGLSMGYQSMEDESLGTYYGSPLISSRGSIAQFNAKVGRPLSSTMAVYLQSSFITAGEHVGLGIMLRSSLHSTLFLFGDVGVVNGGGPLAISGGVGLDISHFTLDISGLLAGGGSGNTTAAKITLSYLWY